MYATPAQLLMWYGVGEIAQVCTSVDLPIVAPELFRATVAEDDRAGWTAEEVASADEALARLTEAINAASLEADGYLATRYTLPLAAGVVATSPLPRHVGAVARYLLYRSDPDEKIIASRHAAITWLKDVVAGRAVLAGAAAPVGGGNGMAGATSARKPTIATDGF